VRVELNEPLVRAVGEAVAKLLEPKTQHVHLTSGTLKTEQDVKDWLAEQEKVLLEKVKKNPIVIS